MIILPQTRQELHNTLTHLVGAVSSAALMWLLIVPAQSLGTEWQMGAWFLGIGTLFMYLCSTIYHWLHAGAAKRIMRILDHIGVYVMIACSYTPICIGVVGGWLGWTAFGVIWSVVVAGACYKIVAIGRYPRLSLFLYLLMGWSIVFIAKPVVESISTLPILFVVLEGLFYTAGTWFFARDSRPYYHAIWHIFVLAGSICHWTAIIMILKQSY